MIIDCHAHVFMSPQIRPYPDMESTLMSVEDQIAVMDAKRIDKAVILPLNNFSSPFEHQSIGEILYICNKYASRFIPFCNIDPLCADREDLSRINKSDFWLEQYKEIGCKGLGELIPRIYWQDPRMLELLAACERTRLAVLFHTIGLST